MFRIVLALVVTLPLVLGCGEKPAEACFGFGLFSGMRARMASRQAARAQGYRMIYSVDAAASDFSEAACGSSSYQVTPQSMPTIFRRAAPVRRYRCENGVCIPLSANETYVPGSLRIRQVATSGPAQSLPENPGEEVIPSHALESPWPRSATLLEPPTSQRLDDSGTSLLASLR